MVCLHALVVNTSEKMWENFKLGRILENRNENVKWNTVTYPLNLPCQWSFVTLSLFPHYFTLCTTSAASNTNTHIARRTHTWRHNSIIPVKKNFHDYCICRKTWKLFFMTISYTVKLGNFKKLIICIVRYIKYLVEKQGCK